ncbi:MAG: hypothetical protein MUO76_22325, partial [Anaerolineaceae bacterium]|nr:hypothetical protein [Anaerolineaceae bacterium]
AVFEGHDDTVTGRPRTIIIGAVASIYLNIGDFIDLDFFDRAPQQRTAIDDHHPSGLIHCDCQDGGQQEDQQADQACTSHDVPLAWAADAEVRTNT